MRGEQQTIVSFVSGYCTHTSILQLGVIILRNYIRRKQGFVRSIETPRSVPLLQDKQISISDSVGWTGPRISLTYSKSGESHCISIIPRMWKQRRMDRVDTCDLQCDTVTFPARTSSYFHETAPRGQVLTNSFLSQDYSRRQSQLRSSFTFNPFCLLALLRHHLKINFGL